MSARIMMQFGGRQRPLGFTAEPQAAPILESRRSGWKGMPFEVHRLVSIESNRESGPLDGEQGVLVVVDGRADVVLRVHGKESKYAAVPGTATLMSGNDRRTVARIEGSAETVAVPLSREWLDRLDTAPPDVDRTSTLAPDATVRTLALAMCEEAKRGSESGSLFAESLSLAFLSYLCGRCQPKEDRAVGGFTTVQRRKLREHVRERLEEDLSLTELSALVGLGPRQFSTAFRQTFGTSPHQYVMAQRLAHGARLIASGRYPLAEVALRCGFSSQSHFTAAFRRTYGTTPRGYARASHE